VYQIVALRDIAQFLALNEHERKHALQEPVREIAKMVRKCICMCMHCVSSNSKFTRSAVSRVGIAAHHCTVCAYST
jgi:hypothetical protein